MLRWADELIQKCVNQKICSWDQNISYFWSYRKLLCLLKNLAVMTDYDNEQCEKVIKGVLGYHKEQGSWFGKCK